jgi:hypothetical protein
MSSAVGTSVTLDDALTEGTDGQYVEVDLTDGSDTPIETAQIVSVRGTLRSLDTARALFEDVDLVSTDRVSYPGAAGRLRVTFPAADLASEGSRQIQRRQLTLRVTYSLTKVFHCAVVFSLVNLADA